MPPIRLYSNWNQRPSDFESKVEPLRRYFFLCEGANTESFYFKKLIDFKSELGIHALIDVVFIEKIEEHKDLSYPKKLIAFAKQKREVLIASGDFEFERDIMIITFDLDVFKEKVTNLDELLKQQDDHLWFGVAYPSFELFLLLHIKDSLQNIILPNKETILSNQKTGHQRACQVYLRDVLGINCKTNENIGELAKDLDIAIEQEASINQSFDHCLEELTSNIGSLLHSVQMERIPI